MSRTSVPSGSTKGSRHGPQDFNRYIIEALVQKRIRMRKPAGARVWGDAAGHGFRAGAFDAFDPAVVASCIVDECLGRLTSQCLPVLPFARDPAAMAQMKGQRHD
jgi:hypothetical protein